MSTDARDTDRPTSPDTEPPETPSNAEVIEELNALRTEVAEHNKLTRAIYETVTGIANHQTNQLDAVDKLGGRVQRLERWRDRIADASAEHAGGSNGAG